LLKECCDSKRITKGVIYFCKGKQIENNNPHLLSQEEHLAIWQNKQEELVRNQNNSQLNFL
jgi:hypothetical protein